MASARKDKKLPKRYLGRYTLPSGAAEVGELLLDGPRTSLTLHAERDIESVLRASTIHGEAYTGERVSLIDCRCFGVDQTADWSGPLRRQAIVFPHFVLVGPTDPLSKPNRFNLELVRILPPPTDKGQQVRADVSSIRSSTLLRAFDAVAIQFPSGLALRATVLSLRPRTDDDVKGRAQAGVTVSTCHG
ncbi:MAG: hypothetical protein OSA97_01065 [Nevskia sp.]|nr:hypothetical protein [Nevskia sp.]